MYLLSDINLSEFNRTIGAKDKSIRKNNKVYYRGKWMTPNHPTTANDGKHKKQVLASKKVDGKIKYKLVKYGAIGYGNNYSSKARKNYLTRSAGIKNKNGKLTMNDKFSPNYHSRRDLWSKNSKPVGTGKFK